jgi:4a-hydroxytetrahydrobiopterin dehydratase
MPSLHQQHCVPCEGGVPALQKPEALKLAADVQGWDISADATSISKKFHFETAKQALIFINKVGEIAEQEQHHPDIHWWWNTVQLISTTHAIKGLSNNDFILASKINQIPLS